MQLVWVRMVGIAKQGRCNPLCLHNRRSWKANRAIRLELMQGMQAMGSAGNWVSFHVVEGREQGARHGWQQENSISSV